jgi:NADP-dependent 3-hydroxy acid dehydrogenase YdfG
LSVFARVVRPGDGSAWITGASGGIGAATALALAADGWTVHATARRAEQLEKLAATAKGPGRILPLPADVTDARAMRRRSRRSPRRDRSRS